MGASDRWLERGLTPRLRDVLADTTVVCLLGARQVGKSSLVRTALPDREYVTFDDVSSRDFALADPIGFIRSKQTPLTLDEVQRVPDLMLAIKAAIDADRTPGRFLLTGSANLLLLPRVADSLAGRMEILTLEPLSESEKDGTEGSFLARLIDGSLDVSGRAAKSRRRDIERRVLAGGFPEPSQVTGAKSRRWHRNYVQAILQRDIQDISKIRDLSSVQSLLSMSALRTGEMLNLTTLANELRIRRETVDSYLSVLERLFLVRRLPAFHSSRAKRLVKTPKIHLVDSGLAAALTGLDREGDAIDTTRFGHLLETFVLQQLVAQASWSMEDVEFSYYRDKDQIEVDLVITKGAKVWGVEIKASETIRPTDGDGLRRLAAVAGRNFKGGVLLHAAEHRLPLPIPGVHALPISDLWSV